MTTNETSCRERFEQCVHAHSDSLYRVAYRLTGSQERAEDLVQESYYQAWANIDQLRDNSKIRSWMFSILRNQYSKWLRKRGREETMSPDQSQQVIAEVEATDTEIRDGIHAALQQVETKFKLPLLLVAMEGMSVDDAAEVLQVPRGTVLSRLHRGRAKLKSAYQQLGAEVDVKHLSRTTSTTDRR